MPLTEDGLESFGGLAKAIGLLGDTGPNGAWFTDPLGTGSNSNGLKTVLGDDAQRNALVGFVDDVLGPPVRHQLAEPGGDPETWVPLFAETDPNITVYAVLRPVTGAVRIGVAVEHRAGSDATNVRTTVHVPVFHVPRGSSDSRPSGGDLPTWLLLGQPGGRIAVSVDAQLDPGPPAPGEAFLGGASVSLQIPTTTDDTAEFSLTLRDLQAPGAQTPTTSTLDIVSLAELGPEVFDFVVGILRQQIDALDLNDATFRHIRGLAGILGLRDVANLPPLPIADLPTQGLPVLVRWLEDMLNHDDQLDAWLGELALLVGGNPLPDRNAVSLSIGPAHLLLGLRVTPGTGGHPVLVPFVEVTWSPTAGADVVASVDLLRADTATSSVAAVPGFRAEAVFGAEATGGSDLLTGTPHVGTLRTGVALDAQGRPAFSLTLRDVDLPGGHHDVLDLSSPQAALEAVGTVVNDALAEALDGFGDVGDLLKQLLGIAPPGGVTAVTAGALLADPLGALSTYWSNLLANSTAMIQVLGSLQHLVTGGVASVSGDGTGAQPWRFDVVSGVGVRCWREDSVLVLALGADVLTPLPGDLVVATSAEVVLLRADLQAKHVALACGASAQVVLRPAGVAPMELDLGLATLRFSGVGVAARWAPATGLRVVVLGDGLALAYVDPHTRLAAVHTVPLPTVAADGTVAFAPDWDVVEGVVAALLGKVDSPVVAVLLDLLGWRGTGAHLRLAALIADPDEAVAAWATALALDCGHLRSVLGPVAWLLSGGSRSEPLGAGRPEDPYRAPIAGDARAPGLTAWTVPGCPPVPGTTGDFANQLLDLRDGVLVPDGATIAASLTAVAPVIRDLADLLVGRGRLGEGLDSLITRWAGTDGIVGAPTTLPADVASSVLDGFSYAELVAAGRERRYVLDGVAAPLDTIVHVGTAASWLADRPSASCVDATVANPSTLAATATGDFFVRVAEPSVAAAMRPDRDAVAAQAAQLTAVLAARTAPVVLLAYGAAGAAAVRAAASVAQVSAVVTIGAPWSPVSLVALTTGLGGDALRFLDRMVPSPPPMTNDVTLLHGCTPAQRGWSMVGRARETTQPGDLPTVDGETRRAGLEVRAVFGSVSKADVAKSVAAVVVTGVPARAAAADAAAAAASGPPEELHVGVDLPVLSLDLGGLFVGLGAAVDLVSVHAANPRVRPLREVVATLRLGVTDGWLVGGPGAAQTDLEVRWADVRVHVPLDGRAGTAELVLHDARAFTAYRETWVVRAGADGTDATTALPEVKILLSEVVARLRAASPDLGDLLELVGVVREAGLDGDALDQLLHDPVATLRPLVAAHAGELAVKLRGLIGLPTTGLVPTAFRVGVGDAHVDVDLATGSVTGSVGLDLEGVPHLQVDLTATATSVSAGVAVGSIDPTSGGVRIVGHAGTGGATLGVERRLPGASTTSTIGLYPSVDTAALAKLATDAVPAIVVQAVAAYCRGEASEAAAPVLDTALDAVGLLGAAGPAGGRDVLLPIGLVAAPGAWLRARSDPLGATAALLDAMALVVVPGRPAGASGWPISDELTITYGVVTGRLELGAHLTLATTIDGRAVATSVTGGLSIGADGAVQPVLDAGVLLDGTGLQLQLSPTPTLDLVRAAPATPIRIYPGGPGLGQAIEVAAESAVRIVLNELVDHRDDAVATPVRAVGRAVHELGAGLGLLVTDHFTDATIAGFAANPSAALLDRLPNLVTSGVSALAEALDPSQTLVRVAAAAAGRRRITFGTGGHVHIDLDGATPALEVGCDIELVDADNNSMGRLVLERLRLTPEGVQVEGRAGPFAINLGPMTLYPLVVARAGVSAGGFTRAIGIGVGLDPAGEESLEFRWTLDGQPPSIVSVSRDGLGVETAAVDDLAAVALKVLGVAVSLASSVITEQLGAVVTARATNMLQGVLFTGGGRTIDPAFFADLGDPDALFTRLKTLLWNCAVDPHHGAQPARPLALTIGDTVTIGLTAKDLGGGQQHLGLNVSLAPGKKFEFPTSGVKVALEVDDSWIDPHVTGGLSVLVLKGPDVDHLDLLPGFSVGGVGMRFTKASGPLLELGSIALDGIAFHVYAEAGPAGVGGGAKIQLDGLAVAPGGGQGSGVANNIMNDVGSASANNRPVFSPSFAVQKHPGPGQEVGIRLRAGDPPGPWWIVIQRQLGPLYVDRIGFNAVEANGNVTEISLLFTGQLSLFGLTAAVDQLMIKWNGGDVLSISSWSVDLMGLAISADMSGISLSGGLLKIVDGGTTSYVGMLMGRFAAYGLSVFGGYTNDNGHASFFLFGAINGPIGGPPAFFLTGLGGGLGINRGLIIPTDLSQFGSYPFIQALDPGARPPDNPMDELRRLAGYFPHQMGNFWFAAGISFTCFSLVDGVAVVAVSFGNGLDINLLGLARMALPRPGAALVSIELGLLARFSTSEGLFMIKAQLTDNSWLLYEDVRLTGGFAFAIWWKGPLAGQFVLTMGGYHPSFHRDGYPDVPRLGIMWRISDYLVIKGGSYFALTSEALMAGTAVEASLDLGWVWAKVAFGADGIVYFDPFWFEVSAYARISAGIDIDCGFFSISISLTLGATIKVWGPDFAGRVEFEIGPCTVPVEFGSPRKVDPVRLSWDQFTGKYLEAAGNAARAVSAITGRGSLPTSTGGQTGAPSSDGSEALPYQVFAEFDITFTTTIPTSRFDVGTTVPVPTTISGGQPALLGLSPMGAHHLSSTLVVRLDWWNPQTRAWQRVDDRLARLVEGFGTGAGKPGYGTDTFPIGVWGSPNDPDVPVKPVPKGDVIAAGKQLLLVAGVDMPQVGPDIDYHQVRADRRPLPLLATGPQRAQFLTVGNGIPAVPAADPSQALASAAQRLFVDRELDGVLVARGGHSVLAAASFVQDRSAPPMFGTLTDGLAKTNGDSGAREVLDPPAPYVPRETRSPFVAGYLTAGAGAALRSGVTTVGDGRIKRRPAPTVESVHGRLALHMPTTLHRAASPTVASGRTVVASAAVPRTDATGAMRSYVGARVGAAALQGLVAGLAGTSGAERGPRRSSRRSARADSTDSTVRSGDLLVLQLPDAAIDVDAERRPSVAVSGRARVTVVLGRTVLLDEQVIDGSVTVPHGATHIGVQADGELAGIDGYAGWHDRTRVARIGAQSALAAGCVLSFDAAGGGPVLRWDTAGAAVAGAREVTTRFTQPVTTVAVALSGSTATSLAPTQLTLVGARVATNRDGTDQPPVAVTLGDTSVLVYPVVPDEGATAVSVVVGSGADWVVSGVVGTTETVTDVADRIARQRLTGVTAKLLALAGNGCSVTWVPAPAPAPRKRAAKTATAKKTTAKKATAKKATAKKTTAKKATAKKATAKKATAKKATAKKATAKKATAKKTTAKKTTAKKATAKKTTARRRPR